MSFEPETGLKIQRVAGALVVLAVYFDFSELLLESLSCRLPRVVEAPTPFNHCANACPLAKDWSMCVVRSALVMAVPSVPSQVASSPYGAASVLVDLRKLAK